MGEQHVDGEEFFEGSPGIEPSAEGRRLQGDLSAGIHKRAQVTTAFATGSYEPG